MQIRANITEINEGGQSSPARKGEGLFNGVDLVGFFITFGGGFIIGSFFGIMLASMMAVSSADSRQRERTEEQEKAMKECCDSCFYNIDGDYCRFWEEFNKNNYCDKWRANDADTGNL